jgi:hypothetical protein
MAFNPNLENNTEKLRKKRGPYRTIASGKLPKKRSQKAIENLAKKSAARGKKLEYMTQTLKRRDNQIIELKKALKATKYMAHSFLKKENLLLKKLKKAHAKNMNIMTENKSLKAKRILALQKQRQH